MKNIILLFSILVFASCDVVDLDDVYEEMAIDVSDSTASVVDLPSSTTRKVLLEYYTGHLCGNCPQSGGGTIEDLKALYDTNLLVISIHAGFFARNNPNGLSFFTDFRTDVGNELDDRYGVTISGTPKGLVNRSEFQNATIHTPTNWGAAISSVISTSTTLVMQSDSKVNGEVLTYNLSYRKQEGSSLKFYVIEDNIIDWQRDYSTSPEDIRDYTHHYVLRDEIVISKVSDNEGSLSFDYMLGASWDKNNTSIIALIVDDKTGDVLQVE